MAYLRGKSGSFTFGDSYLTIKINWSETYDIDKNDSVVSIDSIEVKTTSMVGTWFPSLIVKVNNEEVVAMQYYNPASHKVSVPSTNTYYTVVPASTSNKAAPWVSSAIPHDDEGHKTIDISVVANPAGHNLTSIQMYRSNGTIRTFKSPQTETVALTDIPRIAILRVGNGVLGEPLQIKVDRYFEDLPHTVTCTVGNLTETICEKDMGTDYEWIPPIALAAQITNAITAKATYKVTTYNGKSVVGTHTVTADLQVPESVIPSASATWHDESGAFDRLNAIVKLVSKLSVDVIGTGIYGSSITSAAVMLNGKNYTGGVIMESGVLQLVATVTDSRGRSASASYDVYVADYQTPTAHISASRCLENGTHDDLGEFAEVTVSGFVSPVDVANTAMLTLKYGRYTKTETIATGQINYTTIIPAPSVSTLDISATIADELFTSPTTKMVLSIGYATVDYMAGGKGIAFGTTAKKEGFTCAMPTDFKGFEVVGLPEPEKNDAAVPKSYVDKTESNLKEYIDSGSQKDPDVEPIVVSANTFLPVVMEQGAVAHISYKTSNTKNGDIFLMANGRKPDAAGYSFAGNSSNFTAGQIGFAGSSFAAVVDADVRFHGSDLIITGQDLRGNNTGVGRSFLVWRDINTLESLAFSAAGTVVLVGMVMKAVKIAEYEKLFVQIEDGVLKIGGGIVAEAANGVLIVNGNVDASVVDNVLLVKEANR